MDGPATLTTHVPHCLLRCALRRYPEFPDMRAALAAALWASGKEAEAESQWCVHCGTATLTG